MTRLRAHANWATYRRILRAIISLGIFFALVRVPLGDASDLDWALAAAGVLLCESAYQSERRRAANWRDAARSAEAHNTELLAEVRQLRTTLIAHRIHLPPTPRSLAGRPIA